MSISQDTASGIREHDSAAIRGNGVSWRFNGVFGELRGVFGLHLARIAVQYGVEIENDLSAILLSDAEP